MVFDSLIFQQRNCTIGKNNFIDGKQSMGSSNTTDQYRFPKVGKQYMHKRTAMNNQWYNKKKLRDPLNPRKFYHIKTIYQIPFDCVEFLLF